ncbi:hypothetical protein Salat_1420800 [Sesamum alatum]|uniref:Uncharacterized protein n=1 Tax=Sesamum alatum TaxID=300844 RepID=A0AAE1YAQ5_9LAMI|nr:hypothetical protein Salat_1420800 [Sesamum alatum]
MPFSTTTCKLFTVQTPPPPPPPLRSTALYLRRKMGGDIFHRRTSYLSGCMSPSCVPVHEEYSRIHINSGQGHRRRRLRKLLRKIVNESRSIYGAAKPLTFQYDAVSYSQNFDDGCHRDDEYPRCPQLFPLPETSCT